MRRCTNRGFSVRARRVKGRTRFSNRPINQPAIASCSRRARSWRRDTIARSRALSEAERDLLLHAYSKASATHRTGQAWGVLSCSLSGTWVWPPPSSLTSWIVVGLHESGITIITKQTARNRHQSFPSVLVR